MSKEEVNISLRWAKVFLLFFVIFWTGKIYVEFCLAQGIYMLATTTIKMS